LGCEKKNGERIKWLDGIRDNDGDRPRIHLEKPGVRYPMRMIFKIFIKRKPPEA